MINPTEVLTARDTGELTYALITDQSGEMNRILARLGLQGSADALIEHDREAARAILKRLLWKDMAYDEPCMPKAQAQSLAEAIIASHAYPESRFYSNGNWGQSATWSPLTSATFDSGLIITGVNHRYFCIWFQDED